MNAEDPLAEIEAARARVDAQVRAAEARQAGVELLAGELQALSATVRSAGGEVSVTAQPSGRIVSIELTAAAERIAAAALARLITETVAQAQHRVAMDAVARSAATLGEESPFVDQLRADAVAAFPEPGRGDTIEYR